MKSEGMKNLEHGLFLANEQYQKLFNDGKITEVYAVKREDFRRFVKSKYGTDDLTLLDSFEGIINADNKIYLPYDAKYPHLTILHDAIHRKFNKKFKLRGKEMEKLSEVAAYLAVYTSFNDACFENTKEKLHNDANKIAEIINKSSNRPFSFWWKILVKIKRLEDLMQHPEFISTQKSYLGTRAAKL